MANEKFGSYGLPLEFEKKLRMEAADRRLSMADVLREIVTRNYSPQVPVEVPVEPKVNRYKEMAIFCVKNRKLTKDEYDLDFVIETIYWVDNANDINEKYFKRIKHLTGVHKYISEKLNNVSRETTNVVVGSK